MDEYVPRNEYEEYKLRQKDMDDRQNARLGELQETVKQIGELTSSVKELAIEMKNMSAEQAKQGQRLEALENRDGEMWRKVVSYAVTAAIGILIGFLLKQVGIF